MGRYRQSLGHQGESLAAEYLTNSGYTILDRNARTEYGEIDLVAQRGDDLVFVEVKTRRSLNYGWPEEAVTRRKQRRLVAAAEAFMQEHPELDGTWRIDVISILYVPGQADPTITHFPDAFS